jgi:hypothetical protein
MISFRRDGRQRSVPLRRRLDIGRHGRGYLRHQGPKRRDLCRVWELRRICASRLQQLRALGLSTLALAHRLQLSAGRAIPLLRRRNYLLQAGHFVCVGFVERKGLFEKAQMAAAAAT